jgi:hypothetical protein
MGFAMCVVNLGIVAVTTSATRKKQNEQKHNVGTNTE